MNAPLMRMGLIGFPNEQYYANLLMTRSQNVRWQPWSVPEADALWVNGEHALPVREHYVRIPSGQPEKPAISLNLVEIDRPIAFTLPIRSAQFKPPLVFDPHSADSVAHVLRTFETQLLQSSVELALGEQIALRRNDLRSPVFHLMLDGALVGVVNMNGEVALSIALTGTELARAEWSGRPAAADAKPADFFRTTMARVMWRFVGRSDQDVLPSRYRKGKIYYRRMPSVSSRVIRDSHLAVISELASMPQRIEELSASTGMGDRQISQVLSALYFAGAITTDPQRAAAGRVGAREEVEGPASNLNSDLVGDAAAPVPPRPGRRASGAGPRTVPTPLEPKR